MKLFVDVGNTAMKWRFRHGEKVEQGAVDTGETGPLSWTFYCKAVIRLMQSGLRQWRAPQRIPRSRGYWQIGRV